MREGKSLSVYCGERCPIDGFDVGGDATIAGPMGFAVTKSRLEFSNLRTKVVSGLPPVKTPSPYKGDDCHLVDIIEQDVIEHDLGVSFEQIASLEDAKRLLDEAVTLPLIIPEFFTGNVQVSVEGGRGGMSESTIMINGTNIHTTSMKGFAVQGLTGIACFSLLLMVTFLAHNVIEMCMESYRHSGTMERGSPVWTTRDWENTPSKSIGKYTWHQIFQLLQLNTRVQMEGRE